jgi:hypothetical protein
VFGDGIARLFMMPYNFKVWAHPPRMMNKEWIGERMAVVNLQKVLGNIILQQDDVAWGPNSTFKYPRYGGTGGLFARMQPCVQDQLRLNARVATVNPLRKEVQLEDGTTERYDLLLSTMPLDLLVQRMTDGGARRGARAGGPAAPLGLLHRGRRPAPTAPSEKCWIYFPETTARSTGSRTCPIITPDVVPDSATHYSLLAEISRSEFKPVDHATVVDDTIDGMVATRLLREEDRKDIVDAHLIERDYTYPVPSLERDRALACLLPWLDSEGVFSRGRFGAWRYEVGNMDHSVAQGVEWVDRVLLGGEARSSHTRRGEAAERQAVSANRLLSREPSSISSVSRSSQRASRRCNDWRCRPSARAVCAMLPPCRLSAAARKSRSNACSARRRASAKLIGTAAASEGAPEATAFSTITSGRSRSVSMPPSASTTPRSITLRSSRTLPGQLQRWSA